MRRHKLEPGVPARRIAFCTWFLNLEDDEQMAFLVSDEANFHVSGHVNSRNVVRYPLDRNGRPEQHVVEETAHSPKLMVFAGPWDGNVFGYSVFRNRNMNGVMYNLLLTQRVLPELKAFNGGVLTPYIWQQDGAP